MWNVVKINSNWYSVDLTFSDNRIYFNDFNKGFGISSHSSFLNSLSTVYDETVLSSKGITNLKDNNAIISSTYPSVANCSVDYDYYNNKLRIR